MVTNFKETYHIIIIFNISFQGFDLRALVNQVRLVHGSPSLAAAVQVGMAASYVRSLFDFYYSV